MIRSRLVWGNNQKERNELISSFLLMLFVFLLLSFPLPNFPNDFTIKASGFHAMKMSNENEYFLLNNWWILLL